MFQQLYQHGCSSWSPRDKLPIFSQSYLYPHLPHTPSEIYFNTCSVVLRKDTLFIWQILKLRMVSLTFIYSDIPKSSPRHISIPLSLRILEEIDNGRYRHRLSDEHQARYSWAVSIYYFYTRTPDPHEAAEIKIYGVSFENLTLSNQ